MDNLMTTYGTSEMLPSRRSSCSDASSRPSTSLGGRPPAPPQPVSAPPAPLVVSKPASPAGDPRPAGAPVPVHKPAGSPAVARRASEPGSPVKGADLMEREELRRKSGEADTGLQFVEGQRRAAQKAKQELLLARNLQQAAVSCPGDVFSQFKLMSVLLAQHFLGPPANQKHDAGEVYLLCCSLTEASSLLHLNVCRTGWALPAQARRSWPDDRLQLAQEACCFEAPCM